MFLLVAASPFFKITMSRRILFALAPLVLHPPLVVGLEASSSVLDRAEWHPNNEEESLSAATTGLSSGHRRLPGFFENLRLGESLGSLFSTPMDAWDSGQWIVAFILLFGALWCCGCLAGNRRRYRGYGGGYPNAYGPGYGAGGGYYPRSGGSGGGTCLRNVLLCVCCYEFCCADCQHVKQLMDAASNRIAPPEEEGVYRRDTEIV